MKNFLAISALVSVVAAGAAATYYYGFYLPENDLQMQTKTKTQTPQQVEVYNQRIKTGLKKENEKMDAYTKCLQEDSDAMSAYMDSQCSDKGLDIVSEYNCRVSAMSSYNSNFESRDCREELFLN